MRSQPTGADIIRLTDGLPLGETPWQVEREPSVGELKVTLRLFGYQDRTLSINLAADADVEETLTAVPAELPRPKTSAPTFDKEPIRGKAVPELPNTATPMKQGSPSP